MSWRSRSIFSSSIAPQLSAGAVRVTGALDERKSAGQKGLTTMWVYTAPGGVPRGSRAFVGVRGRSRSIFPGSIAPQLSAGAWRYASQVRWTSVKVRGSIPTCGYTAWDSTHVCI